MEARCERLVMTEQSSDSSTEDIFIPSPQIFISSEF